MSGLDLKNFQPKRGAIADFDFGSALGSQTEKIKPCVVVTNDVYNSRLIVVQVVPITQFSEKKARVVTNVTLDATEQNGLNKKSIADCLQTRLIDYPNRFIKYRGIIESELLAKIDKALAIVFDI